MRTYNYRWLKSLHNHTVNRQPRSPQILTRKPSLELLETRQLLTCSGVDCPDNEVVEGSGVLNGSPGVDEAHFEITAGDVARQFTVDTVFSGEGNPRAIVRFVGDPQNAPASEGDLELSLLVDEAVVDQYRLRIFFPSQYVLDGLRAHRDDLAE